MTRRRDFFKLIKSQILFKVKWFIVRPFEGHLSINVVIMGKRVTFEPCERAPIRRKRF